MEVQHTHKGHKGAFFVEDEEGVEAEMTYSMRGEKEMIIEHTEVSEELRGQNIGFQLVNASVEYARNHGLKIIPLCTFAGAVFERKPEFKDVLQ
jgi:predicted GNAT family acetyltransferase